MDPNQSQEQQSAGANSAVVLTLIVLGICVLIMVVGVLFFKVFRKRVSRLIRFMANALHLVEIRKT